MIQIYTNGCSYTHGHDRRDYDEHATEPGHHLQEYDGYEFESEHFPFVWPYQLTRHDNIDHVFNHAFQGSGFKRTLRTAIDFAANLPKHEYSDWVFILQVSEKSRYEVLDANGDFVKINYDMKGHKGEVPQLSYQEQLEIMAEPGYDDSNYARRDHDPAVSKYVVPYVAMGRSDLQMYYDEILDIISITSLLKSKGIRYLVTSLNRMQYYSVDNYYVQTLVDLIEMQFMLPSLNEILSHSPGNPHDPCYHPSPEGHQYLAKYIIDNLEKRKWI